ncbi:hypothetical protein [Cytobacillus oceanisediminis]|uniref:hypothetical protein n=1 Tax=Cytobacillus oceanisediminis TaxID=665099 RepID=UPI0037352614
MAHKRKDSSKPTTTISLEEKLLAMVEDFRFEKRKENRSAAIADLLIMGLKYNELVEKKRARRALG